MIVERSAKRTLAARPGTTADAAEIGSRAEHHGLLTVCQTRMPIERTASRPGCELRAQKKAPEKPVSQGGRRIRALSGAIGRSAAARLPPVRMGIFVCRENTEFGFVGQGRPQKSWSAIFGTSCRPGQIAPAPNIAVISSAAASPALSALLVVEQHVLNQARVVQAIEATIPISTVITSGADSLSSPAPA